MSCSTFPRIVVLAILGCISGFAQTVMPTSLTLKTDGGPQTFMVTLPNMAAYNQCEFQATASVNGSGATIEIATVAMAGTPRKATFTVNPSTEGSGSITINMVGQGSCSSHRASAGLSFMVMAGEGGGGGGGTTPPSTVPDGAVPYVCPHVDGWHTPLPPYIPSGGCGIVHSEGVAEGPTPNVPPTLPAQDDVITIFNAGPQTPDGVFNFDLKICPGIRGMEQLNLQIPLLFAGNTMTCIADVNTTVSTPTKSNAPNSQESGDPVSLSTGELHHSFQTTPDLEVGGLLPLTFIRYYASYLESNGFIGTMGRNWTHNYDYSISFVGNFALVNIFGGRQIRFRNNGEAWELDSTEKVLHQLLVAEDGTSRFLDLSRALVYNFDTAGKLTRVTDRDGNALIVKQSEEFDGPKTVSDGLGRSLAFEYQPDGKLISVTGHAGRSISFFYVGEQLTRYTDAKGGVTTYAYTASSLQGLLTAVTYPDGSRPFTQIYDASGRVRDQSDSNGGVSQFTHAAPGSGQQTTQMDGAGRMTRYRHQDFSNVTSFEDPEGRSDSSQYDANHRLIAYTNQQGNRAELTYHDPSGQLTRFRDYSGREFRLEFMEQAQDGFRYWVPVRMTNFDGSSQALEYDNRGNLTKYTDRNEQSWTFVYNAQGSLARSVNPRGGRMTISYNAMGMPRDIMYPDGSVESYAYDAIGRVSTITHPDGSSRTYAYDAADRLVSDTDERGSTIAMGYDPTGNVTTRTNPFGDSRTYEYDGNARLKKVTDRNGGEHSYEYDEAGNLSRFVNAAGEEIRLEFDFRGKLTRVTDPLGLAIDYGYDEVGRQTSFENANGERVTLDLDPHGRMTQVTFAGGGVMRPTYDSTGRRTSIVDELGRETTFAYDSNGQTTTINSAGIRADFEYDPNGRLTAVVDPNGNRWTRTYDTSQRLTALTDPLGRSSTISYDDRGRIDEITSPEGVFKNEYDAAGNLIKRTFPGGAVVTVAYDANNRPTEANGLTLGYDAEGGITHSNGLELTRDAVGRVASVTYAPGKTVTYEYDVRGRLSKISDWLSGESVLEYDAADRLIGLTRPNGIRATIEQDADGRLAKIVEAKDTPLMSVEITRDAAGQIVGVSRNAPLDPGPAPGAMSVSYDEANQIEGAAYDGLGYLTGDALRQYTWTGAALLSSYSGQDGAAQFTYDAVGGRISRTSRGTTVDYVLNYGFGLSAVSIERVGGADKRYYVHLPTGAILYSVEADDSRRFFHYDEAGNTIALTNDAGAVTDSYAVTPYGAEVKHDGPSDQPFIFQGALGVMHEPSTSLYYMRARYYDASYGRFLSRDPIQSLDPLAANLYGFAASNPLLYADPAGTAVTNQPGTAYAGPNSTGGCGETVPNVGSTFFYPAARFGTYIGDVLTDFRMRPYFDLGNAMDDWINAIVNGTPADKLDDLVRAFNPPRGFPGPFDPRLHQYSVLSSQLDELERAAVSGAKQAGNVGKNLGRALGALGIGLDVGLTLYDGVKHDDGAGRIALDTTVTLGADGATLAAGLVAPPILVVDLVTLGGVSGGVKNSVIGGQVACDILTSDRYTPADAARDKRRMTRNLATRGVFWAGEKLDEATGLSDGLAWIGTKLGIF